MILESTVQSDVHKNIVTKLQNGNEVNEIDAYIELNSSQIQGLVPDQFNHYTYKTIIDEEEQTVQRVFSEYSFKVYELNDKYYTYIGHSETYNSETRVNATSYVELMKWLEYFNVNAAKEVIIENTKRLVFYSSPVVYAKVELIGGSLDVNIPKLKLSSEDQDEKQFIVTGKILSNKDDEESVISYFPPYTWSITIRKIVSTQNPITIDSQSFDVSLTYGQVVDNTIYTNTTLGTYMITDEDFEKVSFADMEFSVKLIDGPIYFKVVQ